MFPTGGCHGIVCQRGYGTNDFPVYRGLSRQYGHGLGSIFKTVLRTVTPILKPAAKLGLQSIKKVAKEQGIQALQDVMAGKNVKQVLKSHGKQALKSLGQTALNQMSGDIKSSKSSKQHHLKKSRRVVKTKRNQRGRGISRKYPTIKFERNIFRD